MGSLKVYTHHDLSKLAAQFADDVKAKPDSMDLLTPEYLVTQTQGMAKWLTLECTRKNKIFANVETLTPKQFIMKFGFKAAGIEEHPSIFEPDVMAWALYRLMRKDIDGGSDSLQALRIYAGEKDKDIRLFSLSEKIADIFDQYMLYRPELLNKWESDTLAFTSDGLYAANERWQKYLWQLLHAERKADDMISPSGYLRLLQERLNNHAEVPLSALPKRVFLFGMSILPPAYLSIFSKLGELIDVRLYFRAPAKHYYGIPPIPRTTLWDAQYRKFYDAGFQETKSAGNGLLRQLGETGKEFMDLILETKHEPIVLDRSDNSGTVPQTPPTLLKQVQHDIFLNRGAATAPIVFGDEKWSIRLAPCYGPLREVEVLHDLLLDCCAEDASLLPSDILVVTPNVAVYGPLIQMVFGNAKQQCNVSIPFTISDQSVLTDNKYARFAQDLLTAVGGRFEVSEILPLFEAASDLSGCPLNVRNVEQLKRWCKNSGIRWGIDEAFKKDLGLPEIGQFTWQHGFDRLIAGYVMDDEEKMDGGIFPAVEVEGDNGDLFGRFAEFVNSLAELAAACGTSLPISTWNGSFARLMNRLFATNDAFDDEDHMPAAVFTNAISNVRKKCEISLSSEVDFPFAVFMKSVVDELSMISSRKGFFNGKATVSGMIPLRSIPFRVIALIGMNQGAFPRRADRPLFDLMTSSHNTGDHDGLRSDRFLFLETLMSAQDKFIITWDGFDSGDGKAKPPSVLVEALMAHLDYQYAIHHESTPRTKINRRSSGVEPDTVSGQTGSGVLVSYPLHPFSMRYRTSTEGEPLLTTWNKKWFEDTPKVSSPPSIFTWENTDTLQPDDTIDGNKIYSALSDPVQSFLNACRLGTAAKNELVDDKEPFTPTTLDEWWIREAIRREEYLIENEAVEKLAARGGVPAGTPGAYAIAQGRSKVQKHFARIKEVDPAPKFCFKRVDTLVNDIHYRMEIDEISINTPLHPATPRVAISVNFGNVSGKKRLDVWITHLYLNLELPTVTMLFMLNKTITLPVLTKEAASTEILSLHQIAVKTRSSFLPFFPEVSWAFLEAGDDREAAEKNAWKYLSALAGQARNQEYRIDPRLREAFEGAENWKEAMEKIPEGETAFITTAKDVFGVFMTTRGEAE